MAVDGVANSLTESEIVADVPGPENIYRGAFRSVSTALPSEAVAQRDCNHFVRPRRSAVVLCAFHRRGRLLTARPRARRTGARGW